MRGSVRASLVAIGLAATLLGVPAPPASSADSDVSTAPSPSPPDEVRKITPRIAVQFSQRIGPNGPHRFRFDGHLKSRRFVSGDVCGGRVKVKVKQRHQQIGVENAWVDAECHFRTIVKVQRYKVRGRNPRLVGVLNFSGFESEELILNPTSKKRALTARR